MLAKSLTTLICAALVFAGAAAAQEKADPPAVLKSSLSVDSSTLAQKNPNIATIRVENVSGRETEIKSICEFELLSTADEAVARKFSVFGDSYWAPVDVSSGTSLKLDVEPEMLKKGVIEGRVPEASLHFDKDEIKTFKMDLTSLSWNASMGNDWPRSSLFEVVPKGRYWLVFTIGSSVECTSNKVEVTVE